jgi:hypothetical protein
VSVTIVSGTATVNGPVAPNAEWDIVVFRASDLPAELPPANQLSGYATSWSVRIAPQNGQAVPYEVTGEWKSATAEDRVLIVLRSTMGSQVAYFYPAGGTPELTTVNQNSALPGSTLTFELPRP